ncbi:MAG: hypothetical protein JWQ86_3614 [Mycobacterium sp.]|nr:hypothetical protein [Mycobacterium sp.]
MGLFSKVRQLPPEIEAELESPVQIAIKILHAAGATNEEVQRQLVQGAAGAPVPVARLDSTLELMFVGNAIKALNKLGHHGEARELNRAQERGAATWQQGAAAILSARGLTFLQQSMVSFSNGMLESASANALAAGALREWRATNG